MRKTRVCSYLAVLNGRDHIITTWCQIRRSKSVDIFGGNVGPFNEDFFFNCRKQNLKYTFDHTESLMSNCISVNGLTRDLRFPMLRSQWGWRRGHCVYTNFMSSSIQRLHLTVVPNVEITEVSGSQKNKAFKIIKKCTHLSTLNYTELPDNYYMRQYLRVIMGDKKGPTFRTVVRVHPVFKQLLIELKVLVMHSSMESKEDHLRHLFN